MDWLAEIFNAPLNTLLVVGGFLVIILGLGLKVPKIGGIPKNRQTPAMLFGTILIITGVAISFPSSEDTPPATPTATAQSPTPTPQGPHSLQ